MKKLYRISFILSFVMLMGCSEDFLDTKQQGVTSVENFYSTEEEVFQGILGCYDYLQISHIAYDNGPQFCYTVLSDEVYIGGSQRGQNPSMEEVNEFRYQSGNIRIQELFANSYFGVYKANIILDNVADDSNQYKKIARAEAKTLRAYWNFQLVVNWGEVPLVTKVLKPSEYAQPPKPVSEIWAQIEKDLIEAIPDLPLKSEQSTRDKVRLSKGAAQALLGKVYLFQKKYTEAAEKFQEVITSNQYNLYPDFAKILRKDSELGIESVFEIMQPISAYAGKATEPPKVAGLTTGETSKLLSYLGPRGAGWFSAGTTGIIEGNGFAPAKYQSYQAFVDAGDSIRRVVTIISESELIKWYGGKLRNMTYATAALPNGTLAWSNEPCLRLKYTTWKNETGPVDELNNCGTNVRLIRYADVLLMAAEAYNRKPGPDNTKALEYINKVRARAQLAPLSVTGDALFTAIKNERRLELMFEGQRYLDLIRWGDAATVLKDQGKQIPKGDGTWLTVADAGFKERNLLLPIPQRELDVNPNLKQNPGY